MDHTKYPRTWHLPDSPNRGAEGDHACADDSSFEGREVVVSTWVRAVKLVRRDHVETDQLWVHGGVTANGLAGSA